MKLNQTPVRTSRNFNINNIKIEDIEIPEVIREFNGEVSYIFEYFKFSFS